MLNNRNCVIRLSSYKNALYRLKNIGFVKVFSDNLADAVGVTSLQVRKDFSLFGITGNKRGGYLIDDLLGKLNGILGKNEINKVVVVGIGNIGTALIKYGGFEKEGIKIIAGFDTDITKQNRDANVSILPLEELTDFVKTNNVSIGILAVPESSGQDVLDLMVSSGIKGILNFVPLSLKSPESCIITNVNLGSELETLIYFVNLLKGSVK